VGLDVGEGRNALAHVLFGEQNMKKAMVWATLVAYGMAILVVYAIVAWVVVFGAGLVLG